MSKCPSSLQSFHFLIYLLCIILILISSTRYDLNQDWREIMIFEDCPSTFCCVRVAQRESSRRPRLEYKGPLFSWSVWVCWRLRMRLILLVIVLASPLFLCQHLTPQERKILETEYFLQKLMEELSVQPKMIIAKANKGMRRLVHFH